MDCYFEVWLRGFAKDKLRAISSDDSENNHPHITLVRPFNILTTEDDVKNKTIAFCRKNDAIKFSLEGKGDFDGKFYYVPVANDKKLLEFNNGLEEVIKNDVNFAPLLNDKKILHATVDEVGDFNPVETIDQYMLRLTALKNKKIWFSYDFVTGYQLTREESLDKKSWLRTVHEFTTQTGLIPTRNGFVSIK